MLSVNITMYKKIRLLTIVSLCWMYNLQAQTENSPYSRYGLGDQLTSQPILNRAMGGITSAYWDYNSVNFSNPASYSRLPLTTFDFGLEINSRTLREINPPRKFTGTSPIISYVQVGVPLIKNKWGLNIGLRPLTRINYKIENAIKQPHLTYDSTYTLYEGFGGSNEVYVGTGYGIKNFSAGINVGYLFGSKHYRTQTSFINDTVLLYKSNHEKKANYGGLFVNAGVQWSFLINKEKDKATWLKLGANGRLKRNFKATKDYIVETFEEGVNGNARIDSVYEEINVAGKVIYPSSFTTGIVLDRIGKWLVGADFSTTKWSDYRFFGEKDELRDSWKFSLGAQIIPNAAKGKTYLSQVAYRAGFNFGKDYVNAQNKDLSVWAVSFGAGFPMRRTAYSNQFSVINTTFEFGQRGNSNKNLIRENFFRISFGLTLSDVWFVQRKYD